MKTTCEQTNVPHVYAIGDVLFVRKTVPSAESRRSPLHIVVLSAGPTGADAGRHSSWKTAFSSPVCRVHDAGL